MLRYVKYQMKSQLPGIQNKWFLRIKHAGTIDLDGLAEYMASHNTSFSKGVILGLLTDMAQCIREMLLEGYKVKLDDIGILNLGIRCRGEVKPENLTSANIKTYTVQFRGTGDTSVKSVAQKVRLKESDIYELPGSSAGSGSGA